MKYLKLIRVRHYLKNILVLLPLIFSELLLDRGLFTKGIVLFVSFSFLSSIIYIINDLMDIEKDRLHPLKKNRPIARGDIKLYQAIVIIVTLLILIIALLSFNNMLFNAGNFILLIYLMINILYSLGLKDIPLLDITILAFCFILRVLYGGVMLNIEISSWLFLTILSGFYYMALGKRRNEQNMSGSKTREVLKYYNKDFLDKAMYIFLGLSIVFYALWAAIGVRHISFIYSVIMVIIILLKYSIDVSKSSYADPIDIITNDKILMILCVLYGIYCLFTLYGGLLW